MDEIPYKKQEKYFSTLLDFITIILFILTSFGIIDLFLPLGRFSSGYWMVIAGSGFIAFFTPIYSLIKRKYPKKP